MASARVHDLADLTFISRFRCSDLDGMGCVLERAVPGFFVYLVGKGVDISGTEWQFLDEEGDWVGRARRRGEMAVRRGGNRRESLGS